MTDMERLIAAADDLAALVEEILADDRLDNFASQEDALTKYRAAREAVTKGIPPDALIRAALEAAAEKANFKLVKKQLFKEAQSVTDAIRALADDPDFIARITKEAEGRG